MGRRNDDGDDPCTVTEDSRVIKDTGKALLVDIDGDEVWIPKSVIHDDSEVYKEDTEGELIVKLWWAREHGYD